MLPETVLATIVQTVREALKLPYAAIVLVGPTSSRLAASSGSTSHAPLRLPLRYQQEPLGELLVAPRYPNHPLTLAENRLLEDLARQAGVAMYAVRLTADLQLARERLVHTAEEERRRLRRDLHDGLGPMLAGQVLRAGAVRRLVTHDAAAADTLLAQLEGDLERAVAGLRGLVYNLRPPALDELGLVGAIRASVAGLIGSSVPGVPAEVPAFHLQLPDNALSSLPAAVEVAAYRIVEEALANVVRHARARNCHVQVRVVEAAHALEIEVVDDGRGLPVGKRKLGVGLASMRERAAELGGACQIEPRSAGGTRVLAQLPLAVVRQGPD
jgi:signal transduction histidine kinase